MVQLADIFFYLINIIPLACSKKKDHSRLYGLHRHTGNYNRKCRSAFYFMSMLGTNYISSGAHHPCFFMHGNVSNVLPLDSGVLTGGEHLAHVKLSLPKIARDNMQILVNDTRLSTPLYSIPAKILVTPSDSPLSADSRVAWHPGH